MTDHDDLLHGVATLAREPAESGHDDPWDHTAPPSAARIAGIKDDVARLAPPPAAANPTPTPEPSWWARLLDAWGARSAFVLAAAAAAAAALVLWPAASAPPLPEYSLLPVRGIAETRSADVQMATPLLSPTSTLTVTLKPEVDAADVAVRVLVVQGSTTREVMVPADAVRPNGVIELRVVAAEWLGDEPGQRSLVVAVGRPEVLAPLDLDGLPTGVTPPEVQVFRQAVQLTTETP